MNELKAYQVTEDYERHAVIVFATNGATARRIGAAELNIEFEDVDSCRRKHELDKYAPGPVPPLVLINEHGWSFECLECGRRVHEDMAADLEDDGLNPGDFEPIEHGDIVFCSSACQHKFEDYKRKKAEAKKELERVFLEKFPGATPTHVHVSGCELETGHRCSVTFTFPGAAHGNGLWAYGEDTVSVPMIDMDAYMEWRNSQAKDARGA